MPSMSPNESKKKKLNFAERTIFRALAHRKGTLIGQIRVSSEFMICAFKAQLSDDTIIVFRVNYSLYGDWAVENSEVRRIYDFFVNNLSSVYDMKESAHWNKANEIYIYRIFILPLFSIYTKISKDGRRFYFMCPRSEGPDELISREVIVSCVHFLNNFIGNNDRFTSGQQNISGAGA